MGKLRGEVVRTTDGEEVRGVYEVKDGFLTLTSKFGSTTAHLKRSAPEALAGFLLQEQISKSLLNRKAPPA